MGKSKASTDAGAKNKKLRRQTTDQTVEKAIRDNCKGWSEQLTHVKQNDDGQTLYDLVKADIYRKRTDASFRLGALRWRELKSTFAAADDAAKVLVVPDPPEVVPPALLKACVAAKRQHSDRQPLIVFLANAPELNRTATIGVLKLALSMNARCAKQLPACLEVCRWMQRQGIMTKYAAEFAVCVTWVDTTLCAVFARGGLQPLQFLSLHRGVCSLLLPAAPLDTVAKCNEQWTDVDEALNILVASSQLGTELFSFAVVKGLNRRLDMLLDAQMAKLGQGSISRASVDKLRAETLAAAESMTNVALLPARREVDVPYRGLKLKAKVSSLTQQVSLRVSAAWKTIAVSERRLQPFWADELLFSDLPAKPAKLRVEKSLADAAALARQEADKLFKEEQGEEGMIMWQSLKPRASKLLAVDPEFSLECMAMEAICGDGAAALLVSRMLEALPTESHEISVEECLQKVSALSHSSLHKLAPKAGQVRVSVVMGWLSRIMEGRSPDIAVDKKDEVMSSLVARLPFFIDPPLAQPAGSGRKPPDPVARGIPALHATLDAILAKQNSEGADPNDIVPLRVWSYLLAPARLIEAQGLIKSVEASNVVVKSRGKPRKAVKDSAVVEAMALFS